MKVLRETLLLAAMLSACSAPPGRGAPSEESELSFKNMRLTEFDLGRVRFVAEAASAHGSLGQGLVLEDAHVEHHGFGDKAPQLDVGVLKIDAKRASVEIGAGGAVNAIGFDGGVTIVDRQQRTLRTDSARANLAEHRLSVPGHASLESAEVVLHAERVDGNLESEEFTLHGPISGTFDPSRVKQAPPR